MFTVLAAEAPDGVQKALIVAGKDVGRSVHRNRARRRVRAALDLLAPQIGPRWVAVICRADVLQAPWRQVVGELRFALQKLNAIETQDKPCGCDAC